MSQYQLRNGSPVHWDFLKGFLPYKIEPTDIDLAIERKGHFLMLEGKRPGERPMQTGQRRFYDELNALPRVKVVHFCGTPPDEVEAFANWGRELHPGTTEELRAAIWRWFDWVERGAK